MTKEAELAALIAAQLVCSGMVAGMDVEKVMSVAVGIVESAKDRYPVEERAPIPNQFIENVA